MMTPPSAAQGGVAVASSAGWLVKLTSRYTTAAAPGAEKALPPAQAGTQQHCSAARSGCLAGVDISAAHSGAGTGYRLHPAAADSAMHTGALNPAAPRDGFTRVPAALGAYMAAGSCSGQEASSEAWACVDTGASLVATSRLNTYRCSCCTVSCYSTATSAFDTFPVAMGVCSHSVDGMQTRLPLTAAHAALALESEHPRLRTL